MYTPQSNISFLKPQHNLNFLNKQKSVSSSKLNVFPPKILNRTSSYGSNMYLNESTHNSISKQQKAYRNFSKNKDSAYIPKSIGNDSFHMNSSISRFNNNSINTSNINDLSTQRFSFYTDLDVNSDQLMNTQKSSLSIYQRKNTDTQIQKKVNQLQQKIKRNQQNLKFYIDQVQHLKHQLTSSTSNILDSVNTNVLVASNRVNYLQESKHLNKQNQHSSYHNIQKVDHIDKSLTNKNSILTQQNSINISQIQSSADLQKKLKQIDQLKKQVKKILNRQQITKGDIKMYQMSIKEVCTEFKKYLQRSISELAKNQEKNKKKIFDKLEEQIEKKTKQVINLELEGFRNRIINDVQDKLKSFNLNSILNPNQKQDDSNKISKSAQKFLKDPIFIKIKQEVYGEIRKEKSSFDSYKDIIKKNLSDSLNSESLLHNRNYSITSSQLLQNSGHKIILQNCQTTYYVDDEGYLLDKEGYYLLDFKQKKIRLSDQQIQKLQSNNILKQSLTSGASTFGFYSVFNSHYSSNGLSSNHINFKIPSQPKSVFSSNFVNSLSYKH